MSLLKLAAILILISAVSGHKACSRNGNLMKSIQYQLKLVEQNDGKCECDSRLTGGVGFMAKYSADRANIASGSTVVFDTVVSNKGGGYNSKSGIFTAPTAGMYHFTWTILCQHGKHFPTNLRLNNKMIATNHAYCNGIGNNVSSTQSAVLEMVKGDQVRIDLREKGQFIYGQNRWSTFSGFRF